MSIFELVWNIIAWVYRIFDLWLVGLDLILLIRDEIDTFWRIDHINWCVRKKIKVYIIRVKLMRVTVNVIFEFGFSIILYFSMVE